MNLEELFRQSIALKASDIHFVSGEAPRFRVGGKLVPTEIPALSSGDLWQLLEPVISPEAKSHIRSGVRVERSTMVDGIVFTGTVFRVAEDGLMVTFRLLSNDIPSLEEVGFDAHDLLLEISRLPRGLVVLSGQTGSGKWTTACAIVEHINNTSPSRIFVVSGSPSYMFLSKQSLVTDLHIGRECESYKEAMELGHRSDLDVIALDDLPTEEAVREALLLANTGHLVIANLHALDSRDALRILMHLGGEGNKELYRALAANLVAITGQQLLPKIESGRAAAYDWLKVDKGVRELILSGNLGGIQAYPADSDTSRSRREAIQSLLRQGLISPETALNCDVS